MDPRSRRHIRPSMFTKEFRQRQELKKLLKITLDKLDVIDRKTELRKYASLQLFRTGLEQNIKQSH